MIPRWVPSPVIRVALIAMIVALGIVVARDPVFQTSKATDYCALANLRTCSVTQRGEFLLVTTPDGQHMVYLVNGKVVQVQ